MIERVDPSRRGVWVLMDDQFHPRFFGGLFLGGLICLGLGQGFFGGDPGRLGGVQVGLGLGAAIASSNRDRYYDRGYYYNRGYYNDPYYAPPPRVVYRERYYAPPPPPRVYERDYYYNAPRGYYGYGW